MFEELEPDRPMPCFYGDPPRAAPDDLSRILSVAQAAVHWYGGKNTLLQVQIDLANAVRELTPQDRALLEGHEASIRSFPLASQASDE